MSRKGRDFEQLIHQLEKDLTGLDAQILSPGFLTDRITHKEREFDILVTLNTAHHSHVIAIECRDRKSPIGVPDVEGFYSKSKDCKVTKLVMVSSSGFRKTALEKAKFYNIDCISLLEAADYSWLGINHIDLRELKLLNLYFKVIPEGLPKETHKDFIVMHSSGVELTMEILSSNVSEFLHEHVLDQTEDGKVYRTEVPVDEGSIYLKNRETGEIVSPNSDSKFIVVFRQDLTKVPFKISDYSRTTGSTSLAKVAVAKVQHQNGPVNFVITQGPDGKMRISTILSNKA